MALGLGLTAPLVPWLVCAPYGRAAAGRAPPGTSWGLCLPALAPLYAPKPPLPLGGPASHQLLQLRSVLEGGTACRAKRRGGRDNLSSSHSAILLDGSIYHW